MIDQLNGWIAIVLSIGSAGAGVIGGVAIASWRLSAKAAQLDAHDKAIAGIVAACPQNHKELMAEVKGAVCAGFKLALQEIRNEMDRKMAGHDRQLDVLMERMRQAEADIGSIFNKFERREHDYGRADGDRRRQGKQQESFR